MSTNLIYNEEITGMVVIDSGKEHVIVGNGCAGAECIKALRQSGYRGEIHLLTDSRWPIRTHAYYLLRGRKNWF